MFDILLVIPVERVLSFFFILFFSDHVSVERFYGGLMFTEQRKFSHKKETCIKSKEGNSNFFLRGGGGGVRTQTWPP